MSCCDSANHGHVYLAMIGSFVQHMNYITMKTPSSKCRLYLCLIEFRLEIWSVMLVFSTGFVNYCPSNLLSG
jgi:hypothetical protein